MSKVLDENGLSTFASLVKDAIGDNALVIDYATYTSADYQTIAANWQTKQIFCKYVPTGSPAFYIPLQSYSGANNRYTFSGGAGNTIYNIYLTASGGKSVDLGYLENAANKTSNLNLTSSIYYPTVPAVKSALDTKQDSANLTHETWTFTLDDDTTVTKEVVLWTSAT